MQSSGGSSTISHGDKNKSDAMNNSGDKETKKQCEKKSDGLETSANAGEVKKGAADEAKKSGSERKEKSTKDGDQVMPNDSLGKASAKKEDSTHAKKVIEEQEEGEVRSPSPPPVQKAKNESFDDESKKKVTKSNKRERSVTPQSDVERSTRAKSRRRNLDPAAAEAAAVAAAADKQEAISLRPTTRLTSGKIPKVVYNAPQKPMAGESNDSAVEEPTHSRSLSRREKSKRSSRRRAKITNNEASEDGGSSERDELEMEAEEKNQAVYMLTQLAYAVRRTNSITPSTIVTELRGKSIDTEEAKGVLSEIMDNIRQANASVGLKSEGTDLTDQMLAYIATEIARWKSGQPRPASVISRRKARLESKRATVEKLKRRGKKEHDETLSKLETEMEKRRTVDTSAAKMKIHLSSTQLELDRQKRALDTLMREVKCVRMQEQDGRKRVEKTKRLFAQLVQVAKNDVPVSGGGQNIGESVTSNDDEMRVTETQSGSTPVDPARTAEVDRLRRLVRMREAEAEMWQRHCEVNSMKLRELQDKKNRLDNQLYRKRGRNVSRLLAAANTAKKKGDRAERNRHPNGGGGQVGNGRSRGGPTGVTKTSRKNARRDEKGKRRAGRPANS